MYLLPFSWTLVGSLNIAIITALKTAANELATANERQRILFQEVQHRVANTLQAVAGTLQIAQKRVESAPAEAAKLMEDAAQRFAASADVHRRLNDPTLFRMALGSILQDAIFTALDRNKVKTAFDIEELDLTFDQMSAITMLVIESANNAQKHVFQHGIGSKFLVSLKSLARGRAMLTMSDDGPGLSPPAEGGSAEQKLGFRIICGLVNQLRGTFRVVSGQGTEIIVEFPLDRSLN
jgi:two-component sensor histidine kinase